MSKTQCYYVSSNGTVSFTYCSATCCSGEIQFEVDACCETTTFTGIYLGASIGTVTVVGLLCICLACICLKERICKNAQARSPFSVYIQSEQSNDHSGFPEITEPKGPPAYDTLEFPPPYVLKTEQPPDYTSITGTSSTPTILAGNTSHPNNPPLVTDLPPGYTTNTTCTSNTPVTIVVNSSHPDSSRLETDQQSSYTSTSSTINTPVISNVSSIFRECHAPLRPLLL